MLFYIEKLRGEIHSLGYFRGRRDSSSVEWDLRKESRISHLNNTIVSDVNRGRLNIGVSEIVFVQEVNALDALSENIPQFFFVKRLVQFYAVLHFLFQCIHHEFKQEIHLEKRGTELALLLLNAVFLFNKVF